MLIDVLLRALITALIIICILCVIWLLGCLLTLIGTSEHAGLSYFINRDYGWIDVFILCCFFVVLLPITGVLSSYVDERKEISRTAHIQ